MRPYLPLKTRSGLLWENNSNLITGNSDMKSNKLNSTHRSYVFLLYLLPLFIGLIIFYIMPYLYGWYMSFHNGAEITLSAWVNLFRNEVFLTAVANTLLFWVISIPLIIVLSVGISFLTYKNRFKNIILSCSAVPLCIPSIYIGGVVLYIYDLFSVNENSYFAFWVAVIVYIWKYCGFNMIILTSAFSSFPKSLEEAAYLDGCGKISFIGRILLPSVYPELSFVFLLSLLNSFSMYRELYAIYGMYPPKCIYLISHFITNNFTKLGYETVSAASCLLSVFLMIIVITVVHRERRFL